MVKQLVGFQGLVLRCSIYLRYHGKITMDEYRILVMSLGFTSKQAEDIYNRFVQSGKIAAW